MKRVKRRYLALQIASDKLPTRKDFMQALWNTVSKLHGEFGASRTGLALIDYDVKNKMAIIRTSLETLTMVRASIALITYIANMEVSVHVLAVSGTIKALCEKTRLEKLKLENSPIRHSC